MTDRPATLAAGFYVCGTPRRPESWNSPGTAYVNLYAPGMQARHLTPSEARALGAALIAEADHAENGGYRG